jgi:hypothetical protein
VDSLWGIGVPIIFAHSLVDYPLREPALAVLLFAMLGALAARNDGNAGIPVRILTESQPEEPPLVI